MNMQDVYTIEEDTEATEEDYFYSIQRAINSGAWGLQGSYGRAMMDAINGGFCLLGKKPARDYYGNRIPSRDEVQTGTKGSYSYVSKSHGAEWADMMEGAA
jgi:hypothetical protein